MVLVQVTALADGAALLALNRPDKRNALSTELAADFQQAVQDLMRSGVRSAVLAAAGPVFCAGADTKDMEAGHRALNGMLELMLTEALHWTAFVAAPAVGAGLALLAACPQVLATREATFALPELRSGFFPSALMAGQQTLGGARAAYDLAFSARPISAARALEIGLVSRLCDDGDGDLPAREAAVEIAERPAEAIAQGVRQWQELMRPQLLP